MRQSPSTGKKKAQIYDLVAIPDFRGNGIKPSGDEISIMRKELARVREFGTVALNADSLELQIFNIRQQLGISEGV